VRKTKIIATLGPATNNYEIIKRLVLEGTNGFRLNFSHGSHEEKADLIEKIRKIEEEEHIFIPIIADLQGPTIRLGEFQSFKVNEGDTLRLIKAVSTDKKGYIPIPLEEFFKIITLNDVVLLDDGRVILKVFRISEDEVLCNVLQGGEVRRNTTVAIQGKEFSLPPLSEKDLNDLEFALNHDVDIIFQSFVRDKSDIIELRRRIREFGKDSIRIYAKIETRSGVQNIDRILDEADGILIARGDLGTYFPLEEIPSLEALLARKALEYGKPVVLATQLLETMIYNPMPTRAEVVDIYNGVLHGIDALMLSGETAIGQYPILAIRWLRRVIERAEKEVKAARINGINETAYEKFAKGIIHLAESLNAKILAYTKKGATALRLARYRPNVPVYVATERKIVARQLNILWGIKPIIAIIDLSKDPIKQLINAYKEKNIIKKGDIAVITVGLREGTTDLAHVEIV